MSELNYLSFDILPKFVCSSFRYFYPNEKHVSRVSDQDILLLVYSGTLKFSENGKPVEVTAGEYYIQKANILQEGILESNCPKYYYIHFYGTFCDDKLGLPLSGNFSFNEIKNYLYELENLLKIQTTKIIELSLVFYNILECLKKMNTKTAQEETLAINVERILAENYNKPYHLSELEEELNYNIDYIIRNFNKRYGVTPHQYITALRMNQARQLLSSTNRNIIQIAEECGYNDVSSFYRAFIKAHNCSPKRWKNKNLIKLEL